VTIRILVVEDDAPIAHLLTAELERLGYQTHVVETVADASAWAQRWNPQLMLLDLGLPDGDGTSVLRGLREQGSELPVICVTAHDRQTDRIDSLHAGADDYIVKPFDVAELDARIRAVLRRSKTGKAQDLVYGTLRLVSDEVRLFANGKLLALTPREVHVIRDLLGNAGQVVTKAQLNRTLTTLNESIGEKTIEVYIHRIRNKLEGCGVEIVTVRGFGYLLRETPDAPGRGAA
jgi:DNA-binding response OmpR family regulator